MTTPYELYMAKQATDQEALEKEAFLPAAVAAAPYMAAGGAAVGAAAMRAGPALMRGAQAAGPMIQRGMQAGGQMMQRGIQAGGQMMQRGMQMGQQAGMSGMARVNSMSAAPGARGFAARHTGNFVAGAPKGTMSPDIPGGYGGMAYKAVSHAANNPQQVANMARGMRPSNAPAPMANRPTPSPGPSPQMRQPPMAGGQPFRTSVVSTGGGRIVGDAGGGIKPPGGVLRPGIKPMQQAIVGNNTARIRA